MAQPITELPLFRLLFLPAICYLFYWIQADWAPTSSRTIMRHESGSLQETPATRGLHPTNPDSFHTRSGRWLTSNSAQCVAQSPIVPYSFRIPTSERKQARRVSGLVHCFVLGLGGPKIPSKFAEGFRGIPQFRQANNGNKVG
jgi:hypothetical protein